MDNNYDIVKYIEENFSIELLEYQKEMLRQTQSMKHLYIIPARHSGFTAINTLTRLLEEENQREACL